jgi:hypothetical protein
VLRIELRASHMLSPLSSSSSSCSSSSSSVNRTSVRCYLIVVSIFLSVIIEMFNICHIYIYIYIYIYISVAISVSSFGQYLFRNFTHFWIRLLLFYYWVVWIICIFLIEPPYPILQYFIPLCRWPLHSVNCFLCWWKLRSLMNSICLFLPVLWGDVKQVTFSFNIVNLAFT